MEQASAHAEKIFAAHGVKLTLGGEPTYIPVNPDGPEWQYSAVGPTKLAYAYKVADAVRAKRMPDSAVFFCPGKSYPGEVNPRWVIRLIANRDGSPLFRLPAKKSLPTMQTMQALGEGICAALKVKPWWVAFTDTLHPESDVLAMPLDHNGAKWVSARWPLEKKSRELSTADGPAGLRLPLHLLPEGVARRSLTLERRGDTIAIFIPPLLQKPFIELLKAVETAAQKTRTGAISLQGYTAPDEAGVWTQLGLAADPGVLEINLPPCVNWNEYAGWLETLASCCESAGLRSWKETPWNHPEGSGGGNHLLWGGATLETNPFFTRPRWLASLLRFWQHHPSLAYIFTGCYVGASSQAPRPDESARDLYDIDMGYTFLETLPEGDHRQLINETLRHIHTDVTGNSHRSEMSFDKFWNLSSPSGALGLIEFRAIESFPRSDWMAAIALLWSCLAANGLATPAPKGLKRFGTRLNDEFFLPTPLWNDLEQVLATLTKSGFSYKKDILRDIWAWRFPVLAEWKKGASRLTVRKALEGWPLLCETPVDGGTTSRFVDTSMQRLEFTADESFVKNYEIFVSGRPLALKKTGPGAYLAGLRYRRTNLYPSLHPGIPPQLPLHITIVDRNAVKPVVEFEMAAADIKFRKIAKPGAVKLGGSPCRAAHKGDFTCDLRLD